MDSNSDKQKIAQETKALVALAFRNGPIEDIHAGKACPTCNGRPEYAHVTDDDMMAIMKSAVDQLYRLLVLKAEDPRMYESEIRRGTGYTAAWDEPKGAPGRAESRQNEAEPHAEIPHIAVLITMPLRPADSTESHSDRPHSFEQDRNRLEEILSYIGFTIRQRGIASAFDCTADDKGLRLLLTGLDAEAIQAELLSYLRFFRLPQPARIATFTDGSSEPAEIELN
jgi:hypothetical protein